MTNVRILKKTPAFTPSQRHRKTIATTAAATAAAATIASETEIILSDATIGITIYEMNN